MPVRAFAITVALAATITLAACGMPPAESAAVAAAGQSAPATSPTPVLPPTPTIDQTALKPGTNHNYAAAAYAFEAKDVHEWLTVGETARHYPPAPIVFLTFDDGPNNRVTPRVLDALKASKVPATFFYVTGPSGLEKADPAIVKRTIAEGHAIDIHSHSHSYRTLFPGGRGNADNILADREKAITAIRTVLGDDYAVSGYRYPGGHLSWKGLAPADQVLAEQGAYWLDWNAMNGDTEKDAPQYAEGQLAMVKSTLRRSENPNAVVVLMHDHEWADTTVEAIGLIVDYFRDEGYEFGVIN
jgi:peptidoglycan/xylan/chitin deacetylase (PgdA/CDA1 family)